MNTNQILLNSFITSYPKAAVREIEIMDDDEIVNLLYEIPEELAVDIVSNMYSKKGAQCLQLIKPKLAIRLLEKTDENAAELMLRKCNKSFRNKVLSGLSTIKSDALTQKLSHAENSVGSLMIQNIIGISKDLTIKEAIKIAKQHKEIVSSQIFIVDAEGKLEGIVKMHMLLTGKSNVKLSSVMIVDVPKILADSNIEAIEDFSGWYEFHEIAVIDGSERLIGMINYSVTRKNKKMMGSDVSKDIIQTGTALGELYRIGLTGFLQSLSK